MIGVDLVHGRVADHLACREYWIDRETHLILRIQTLHDEAQGTTVEEVVELRFDPPPPKLFELPEGADVRK